MSRSRWKSPCLKLKNLKKKSKLKKNEKIFIVSRYAEITPNFLNFTVYIHNGKNYTEKTISKEMLGLKFGEFSFTRSNFKFKKK